MSRLATVMVGLALALPTDAISLVGTQPGNGLNLIQLDPGTGVQTVLSNFPNGGNAGWDAIYGCDTSSQTYTFASPNPTTMSLITASQVNGQVVHVAPLTQFNGHSAYLLSLHYVNINASAQFFMPWLDNSNPFVMHFAYLDITTAIASTFANVSWGQNWFQNLAQDSTINSDKGLWYTTMDTQGMPNFKTDLFAVDVRTGKLVTNVTLTMPVPTQYDGIADLEYSSVDGQLYALCVVQTGIDICLVDATTGVVSNLNIFGATVFSVAEGQANTMDSATGLYYMIVGFVQGGFPDTVVVVDPQGRRVVSKASYPQGTLFGACLRK